ncbi:uncharacterized protein DFL_008344 [Arthrobotrys flagrans]|uniref:Uncharacterized protein n=1 Tax=Arthrobotrys flagrans TaxID=97331 RepID=A0A436ZNF4_ARTFL|nr:hypothetical protein DFL_008344 [Arthrobotrys flagrans]
MRYSSIILAAGLGLATSVRAQVETSRIPGCLDDNCLRALKNTQRPGLQDCISFSSAVLIDNPVTETVTSTTTEVTATITPGVGQEKRDFVYFNRRDVVLPSYAPERCTGDVSSRYWSACSCIIRSSSRAGVTTVDIPTVTVTATSWSIIPATATALALDDPPFKISFANNDGIDQYLSIEPEESDLLPSQGQGAIFTPNSEDAAELKVVAGGNLAEVNSEKILLCATAGTPQAFLCGFFGADLIPLSGFEPMKCARTGISELLCGIPDRNFPVWAIFNSGETRRSRRRLWRREDAKTHLGLIESAEELDKFTDEGISIGEARLNNIDAANPPSNSTTTSGGFVSTATTTSQSETATTASEPETTTTTPQFETTTTVPQSVSSTTESEEPEATTTAPQTTTSTTEPEEPETTATAPQTATTTIDVFEPGTAAT